MDALGYVPFIVVLTYESGKVDHHGPFKTRERAREYGVVAKEALRAEGFYVAELVRSFHDEGFDPVC